MSQGKRWTHDELMLFPPDEGFMQMHREEVLHNSSFIIALFVAGGDV